MEARFVVKNLHQLKDELRTADQGRKKAAETATKVEAFGLMKQLKKELRAGAPGGKHLAPLRVITRGTRSRKPLARLAKVVRYKALRKGAKLKVMVGFLFIASSRAWVKIAQKQQEGFTASPEGKSPSGVVTMRKYWRKLGGSMSARSKLRKYFFLRPTTKSLRIPGREIISPFWRAHRAEAGHNIVSNFNRKMRGERI